MDLYDWLLRGRVFSISTAFCLLVVFLVGLSCWLGVWIILGGTVLALIPNAPAPVRIPAAARLERAQVEPVATGD